VLLSAKIGARVSAGEPLCTVHAANEAAATQAAERLLAAYVIADEPALAPAIVLDRITEPGHNPL
jgi:thymidine phosphorylase